MNQTVQVKHEVLEQGYDEIPYDSYPFDYNRPENLKAISTLFGMSPVKLENARILELGCSDGGNSIRFAECYPDSYTLGIDLSGIEIKLGQERIEQLGLKNIELKHLSITDLDQTYGKFNYIICHGVFSWVPDFVKESILRVSNELLNENGVVFISYNTLPGWNMVGTIRELMLYHAANFPDIKQKITQARAAVNFLNETLDGQKTPHAEFMKSFAKVIAEKEDHYVRHEYLAEENKAYYLNDFIKMAAKYSLQYLGDTDVHRMYVRNLPVNTAKKLGAINDIVKTEQYIDFIRNTQFRCTLLCHNTVRITRNITSKLINSFYFTASISPAIPKKDIYYYDTKPLIFFVNNNKEIKIPISSPGLKACFLVLSNNNGNPLKAKEIADLALKNLKNEDKESIKNEFLNNVLRLIFAGYVKIFSDKPKFTYKISNKPKISKLAMLQIKVDHPHGKIWFTNQVNQLIVLEPYQKTIVAMLDEKNTVDEIKAKTLIALKNGEITASRDNKKIKDEKELKEIANETVNMTLNLLRLNYGLIA